ncbi:hypothetical protein [Sorangium sp. So ce1078]
MPPETLALMAEHVPQFRLVLDDVSEETDEARAGWRASERAGSKGSEARC